LSETEIDSFSLCPHVSGYFTQSSFFIFLLNIGMIWPCSRIKGNRNNVKWCLDSTG